MKVDEAKQVFIDHVFVHMPSVYSWLKNHSPKPEETLLVWCRNLNDITIEEAVSVINRWSRGDLEGPTGFAVEGISLHIRAVVMRDRYEAKKHLIRKEITDRGTGPRPTLLMTPYFLKILQNRDAFQNGTIDEQECRQRNAVIVQEFCDLCKVQK